LDKVLEAGTNIAEFLEDNIKLLRLILIMQHIDRPTADEADMSDEMKKRVKDLGHTMSPIHVVKLIDIMLRRKTDMRFAPLPILPLEMIIVEWCDNTASNANVPTPAATPQPPSRPTTKTPLPPEPAKTTLPETQAPIASPITNTEPTPPPVQTQPVSALDFDAVKKAWIACYKSLEDGSPSLASVLKSAVLTSLTGTTLLMTMPLAFYRDAIMEHKEQQRKVETILADNLGQVIHIDIVVDAPPEEATDELDSVTAVFGGQVVG
jgi:DNA polymerase III gamma/tau subunit